MPIHLDRSGVDLKVLHGLEIVFPHEQQMALAALRSRTGPCDDVFVVRAEDRIRMRIQRRKA